MAARSQCYHHAMTTTRKPAKGAQGFQGTPTKTTTPVEVSINVPLPADLHRKVRIKAVVDDMTIKDAVIAALEAWVA